MFFPKGKIVFFLLATMLSVSLTEGCFAQEQETKKKKKKAEPVSVAEDFTKGYTVKSGLRNELPVRTPEQDSLEVVSLGLTIDSLVAARSALPVEDSTAMAVLAGRIDSLSTLRQTLMPVVKDSTDVAAVKDSLAKDSVKLRPRYNAVFRDSLSFPLVTAASMVLPGFAQFYEEKYWKIPVQYAAIGVPLYFGLKQNKIYRGYKAEYDELVSHNATQSEKTPVQTKMMRHDNYRTLLFGAAAAAYVGFLVDGVINYPSDLSRIQKATTLSIVCPGAGQIYNGSYWKLPIVIGGIASMIYVVDWNTRGYQRYKLAYDLRTDGDDTTIDEYAGGASEEQLRTYKNMFRRNRDLSIIGLVGVYLVQVADAHIDAHMQVYDISDKLTMNVSPQVMPMSRPGGGVTNNFGFNFTFNF